MWRLSKRGARRENISMRLLSAVRLLLVLLPSAASAQPSVTFTKDIAPIVWSRCATCHRPGEIGPFSLITYDDVKRRATQIGKVTATPGLMPPWKPLGPIDQFEDDRQLRPAERTSIHDWLAAGAPDGDPR